MPIISEFKGIVIKMFYNEHNPPHFHAAYGEHKAEYEIETLQVLEGQLPRRIHSLVVKWASLHQVELRIAWELARALKPLSRIDPLA
jgi:hypothetical protein